MQKNKRKTNSLIFALDMKQWGKVRLSLNVNVCQCYPRKTKSSERMFNVASKTPDAIYIWLKTGNYDTFMRIW